MAHEGVQPQPQPSASRVFASSPVSDDHIEDFIPSVEGVAREGERDDDEEEEGRSSLGTGLLASLRSRSHSHSHRGGGGGVGGGVGSSSLSLDTESTSLVSHKDSDADGQQQGQHLRGGKGRLSRHLPTLPTLYRNILKCSIAYFFGSLFTYYPPLSRFIAELTQDGPGEKYPSAMGHMVATV